MQLKINFVIRVIQIIIGENDFEFEFCVQSWHNMFVSWLKFNHRILFFVAI